MYESKYIHNNKTKILDKFPQNTSYFVNFSIQKANISDDNIQPRDVNAAPILVEFSGISLSGAITYISFIFINNIISIIGYFNIDKNFCKNNTSKCKIKVVLYYKESMKEMKKNAQKIHSLFIIIETKTVKTHKKTEKHA